MAITSLNNIQTTPKTAVYGAMTSTASPASNFWKPISTRYDKATDWIAENYYERFYRSDFAKKFVQKCGGMQKMTTHMSAIGATLISGMYIIRTLQNDNLDEKKRKTLALNDVLTWGLSTAGSYFLDNKLGAWCDNVTKRFVANYIDSHPEIKRKRTLGDWDAAEINKMLGCKVSAKEDGKEVQKVVKGQYFDLINGRIDKINAKMVEYGSKRKPLEHIEGVTRNIRDFNLDILKNKRLTTLIDGIGVLKSLFVFGMVYRYIVPVLVMKPANKLGAYIHKMNDQKENNTKNV